MNINSNKYTYIFAVVMVVLVAALLSIAATSLKPLQDKNVELEKKSDILASIGIKGENSDSLFALYIKEQLVIQDGQVVESAISPFDIDMAKAVAMSAATREVPLYKAEVGDETFYVIPLRGKGLWGSNLGLFCPERRWQYHPWRHIWTLKRNPRSRSRNCHAYFPRPISWQSVVH